MVGVLIVDMQAVCVSVEKNDPLDGCWKTSASSAASDLHKSVKH